MLCLNGGARMAVGGRSLLDDGRIAEMLFAPVSDRAKTFLQGYSIEDIRGVMDHYSMSMRVGAYVRCRRCGNREFFQGKIEGDFADRLRTGSLADAANILRELNVLDQIAAMREPYCTHAQKVGNRLMTPEEIAADSLSEMSARVWAREMAREMDKSVMASMIRGAGVGKSTDEPVRKVPERAKHRFETLEFEDAHEVTSTGPRTRTLDFD